MVREWKPAPNSRYNHLVELIEEHKPRTIIEIGTWRGSTAILMAKEALKHQPTVHYTGFDLFEDGDEETDRIELNVKARLSINHVVKTLQIFAEENPGFSFNLIRGNTRETLKEKRSGDFVFLDGGHSVETIRSDFEALKHNPLIILDDYYEADKQGKMPDINLYGCNLVIEDKKYELLGRINDVRPVGAVRMALIKKQDKNNG